MAILNVKREYIDLYEFHRLTHREEDIRLLQAAT